MLKIRVRVEGPFDFFPPVRTRRAGENAYSVNGAVIFANASLIRAPTNAVCPPIP